MTDRKNPPGRNPELYRLATFEDILDDKIHGFYTLDGAYWRKNGKVKTWKTRPGQARVPVKFGMYAYDYVTETDIDAGILYIRIA